MARKITLAEAHELAMEAHIKRDREWKEYYASESLVESWCVCDHRKEQHTDDIGCNVMLCTCENFVSL